MESTLYNGRVQVRFAEESHIYTASVDGSPFKRRKSVTGITGIVDKSDALVPWALEEGAKVLLACLQSGKVINEADIIRSVFASQEKKDTAANIGTAIHDVCEQYIKHKLGDGPMPDLPKDENIALGFSAFLEWLSEHKVEFLWTEKIVYSIEHDFIGKADFGAIVDSRRCLCDLKTGNGLYNGVRTQTAGYALADFEEKQVAWDGRWAIRVAKETEAEYIARMELKNYIKQVLGKKPSIVKPYVVFEAQNLDEDPTFFIRDTEAFKHALGLNAWHSVTR